MRYLIGVHLEGALRRGKSIEQFLGGGCSGTQRIIRWVELRPNAGIVQVWLFEVPDVGSPSYLDVYEFAGDDGPDTPVFEASSIGDALEYARMQLGARSDRWANAEMVQSEYADFLDLQRPEQWPQK